MTLANSSMILRPLLRTTVDADTRVRWARAVPFWNDTNLADPNLLAQPQLLNFGTDDFMTELRTALAGASKDPSLLEPYKLRAERHSEPFSSALQLTRRELDHPKLYQPAHGHFALVTASLICRSRGLPDRTVNPANERVGFVLRRLEPNQLPIDQRREMAWVTEGKTKTWRALEHGAQFVTHEELIPMFALPFCDAGQPRKIWAGLIPTASRETFEADKQVLPSDAELERDRQLLGEDDPRLEVLKVRVINRISDLDPLSFQPALEAEASQFLLLDMAEWLVEHLPETWTVLQGSAPTDGPHLQVYQLLENTKLQKLQLPNRAVLNGPVSWRAAMLETWGRRSEIYGEAEPDRINLEFFEVFGSSRSVLTSLQPALKLLLTNKPATAPLRTLPKLSRFDAMRPKEVPLYVLRCVYQRPHCPVDDLVGEASIPFSIASFFDPDAPARPVRITLPDTSISNLRKFQKNVSFSMSKRLRGQMDSVGNAKNALKGEIGSERSFDLGTICSFSIPIITICAFMVLMIFLMLLNIVFFWVPFFRICLPIPRPK
jgi:hypothetical protein